MVSTPYKCPIYFSSLVAKCNVYRRIYHLQARGFIFPLPSVNYDVDLYTLWVSKSVTGIQHYQCCSSMFDGKSTGPRESTILKCINTICTLSFSGGYFVHCLSALAVLHWDLSGLLVEVRTYSLLPATCVSLFPCFLQHWSVGSCISRCSEPLPHLCQQKPHASGIVMPFQH